MRLGSDCRSIWRRFPSSHVCVHSDATRRTWATLAARFNILRVHHQRAGYPFAGRAKAAFKRFVVFPTPNSR